MRGKEFIAGLLKSEKRVVLITVIGICGIVLILLSSLISGGKYEPQLQGIQDVGTGDFSDYSDWLEHRLGIMIAEIEGVGRSRVMVTVQDTGEYVFVQEEKRNVDKTTDPSLTERECVVERENIEQKYVLVDSGRQALIKTQLKPSVQGVVVICEGADDVYVQSRVVNVVTTALHITSTRVCVEKITSNDKENIVKKKS